MKKISNILILLIIIIHFDAGKLNAQLYKTYYRETLDSITLMKINEFLINNYPNHYNNFNLHYCRINETEDTIWYGINGREKYYLQKYLFVYTYTDDILGISEYLINISFNKEFNISRINFPYNSKYQNLRIASRTEITNEIFKYRPNFKDSAEYIKTELEYNIEKDSLFWEVCLEREKDDFECLKFEAKNKELVEEYCKMKLQWLDY